MNSHGMVRDEHVTMMTRLQCGGDTAYLGPEHLPSIPTTLFSFDIPFLTRTSTQYVFD